MRAHKTSMLVLALATVLGTSIVAPGCADSEPVDRDDNGGAAGSSNTCMVHSDCDRSQAADIASQAKCPVPEVLCLGGLCEAVCASACDPELADACNDGGVCIAQPPNGYCRRRAPKCQTKKECPDDAPLGLGGSGNGWTCNGNLCQYPGLTFQ